MLLFFLVLILILVLIFVKTRKSTNKTDYNNLFLTISQEACDRYKEGVRSIQNRSYENNNLTIIDAMTIINDDLIDSLISMKSVGGNHLSKSQLDSKHQAYKKFIQCADEVSFIYQGQKYSKYSGMLMDDVLREVFFN